MVTLYCIDCIHCIRLKVTVGDMVWRTLECAAIYKNAKMRFLYVIDLDFYDDAFGPFYPLDFVNFD